MTIVTAYVAPPIPTTQFDWVAYIKGDEEANGPTGRGPTECEALRDLCGQLENENTEHRAAQAAVFKALGPDADPDRSTWPAQIEQLRKDAERYRWLP